MMPKGVEHKEVHVQVPLGKGVSLPMMPKGVEHETLERTVVRLERR